MKVKCKLCNKEFDIVETNSVIEVLQFPQIEEHLRSHEKNTEKYFYDAYIDSLWDLYKETFKVESWNL